MVCACRMPFTAVDRTCKLAVGRDPLFHFRRAQPGMLPDDGHDGDVDLGKKMSVGIDNTAVCFPGNNASTANT